MASLLAEQVSTFAGFEAVHTFRPLDDVSSSRASVEGVLGPNGIRAWKHSASGVRIVRFCAPGPVVSLTIYVGTEPVGNGGEPHTLEHIMCVHCLLVAGCLSTRHLDGASIGGRV